MILRFNKYLLIIFIFFSNVIYSQIVDYRAYQSPVKNQEGRGTCTAFSICALLETHPAFPSDISEQHIYASAKMFNSEKLKNYQEGAILKFYVDEISKRGFWPESFYPYNPKSVVWNKMDNTITKLSADMGGVKIFDLLTFKTSPFFFNSNGLGHFEGKKARDIQFIKSLLDSGSKAVAVCYRVNGNYWSKHEGKKSNKLKPDDLFYVKVNNRLLSYDEAKRNILNLNKQILSIDTLLVLKNSETLINEGHAVVIVGYDEDGFIIKNSWGSTWGDKGYGWISFDYHELLAKEILYLNPLLFNFKKNVEQKPEAIDRSKIFLKTLPYINKQKKGISISWIYESEQTLPPFSEIKMIAYDGNNKKIGEWSRFFCNKISINSDGCVRNIEENILLEKTNFEKLVVTFFPLKGKSFVNTYSKISAINNTYTPMLKLVDLLN